MIGVQGEEGDIAFDVAESADAIGWIRPYRNGGTGQNEDGDE